MTLSYTVLTPDPNEFPTYSQTLVVRIQEALYNLNAAVAAAVNALSIQGLLSARPAPGTLGRYFWATDTLQLYYDDGAAWQNAGQGPNNIATSQTLSIANGGNAALPLFSGIVVVNDQASTNVGMYLCNAGGTVQLLTTANNWVASTKTPAGGKLSVAYDSSSKYRVYNNQGTTRTVSYSLIITSGSI